MLQIITIFYSMIILITTGVQMRRNNGKKGKTQLTLQAL